MSWTYKTRCRFTPKTGLLISVLLLVSESCPAADIQIVPFRAQHGQAAQELAAIRGSISKAVQERSAALQALHQEWRSVAAKAAHAKLELEALESKLAASR